MIKLPKLALGTWLIGGTRDADPNNDDAKDISAIKTALDCNITLIDTAQNYAGGKCEEIVGKAIKSYSREKFQILTKQNKAHLTFNEVIDGCKESLQRLGVNYIDYFVCHAPNAEVDMHDFFKAANQLHKHGLIRQVGVSNFGPRMLQIATETSKLPVALNQVSFSINDSDILSSGTYEYCIEHGIPIQAYRTLTDVNKVPETANLLKVIADKLRLTSQQVATAYLNSYENMHFTIRASTPQHWQELKYALNIKLDDSDIEALKQMHMAQKGKFGDFLLI